MVVMPYATGYGVRVDLEEISVVGGMLKWDM